MRGFTGRDGQLDCQIGLLSADYPGPVVGIVGAAGVGKTALAVRAGYQVAERFRDGQLYVDLHGVEANPTPSGEVLGLLLRSLGLSGSGLPTDLDERSALYRSTLSGRRILVVLDNARDARQILPLLPGSATCAVIITSRHRIAELLASGCCTWAG